MNIETEKPITIPDIRKKKEKGEKIILAAVWDYTSTLISEEAGADMVSVGGATAAMMLGGQKHALSAEMGDVIALVKNMSPAVKRTVSFVAMPYGSFHISNEQAIRNAIRLIKAGAHSVKMQVQGPLFNRAEAVVGAGVQLVGHVGLLPQYYHKMGGYRVVGKTYEEAVQVYKDVKMFEDIGAYAVEMECVPAKIAAEISKKVKVPILGIGSGAGTDGQILVVVDIWGYQRTLAPKYIKKYIDMWPKCLDALKQAIDEIKTNKFPAEEHSFSVQESEYQKFIDYLDKK